MDTNQYFDENIERAVGIFTSLSAADSRRPETMLRAVLPYIEPPLRSRAETLIKAVSVNRLLQRYSGLAAEAAQIKSGRGEVISELQNELDPRSRQLLEIFVKLTEIKEIMEAVTIG
ncbi:MAG: hypothetical protein IJL89_10120 [Firmicutes bacterium]|nr:hypothetical protein [Bacillota bacterium]